jgi:hypothetical protein
MRFEMDMANRVDIHGENPALAGCRGGVFLRLTPCRLSGFYFGENQFSRFIITSAFWYVLLSFSLSL